MKILVVEDDTAMQELLRQLLCIDGFAVIPASNTADALSCIVLDEPDLVLLDVTLGNEDGRELLREIRCLSDVPVIFLTGRGLEVDRIAGLRMGADDYIVKPFSSGELRARIESVLRRSGRGSRENGLDTTLRFDGLAIDPVAREVHVEGRLIEVTAKEFDVLAFLASSPRQVFTREQLLQQVWDSSGQWQNENTVTEHIRRLRRKLEPDPDHPRWIVTVRGVGYRFDRRTPAPEGLSAVV